MRARGETALGIGFWMIRGLVIVLPAFLLSGTTDAQQSGGGPQLERAFDGVRADVETDRFGQDAVDLKDLGLTVTQELSPLFQVNGLPYQVTAHYFGTGWSEKFAPSTGAYFQYLWFSPLTVWGPLGAGWNVQMGKLLTTGEETYGLSPQCTTLPLCDTYDPNLGSFVHRHIDNTIVEANGTVHPVGRPCGHLISEDSSWLRAETDASICTGVPGWKAPDGTLYELNQYRLVRRITDLSGNRIEIEYYDPQTLAQVRDCTNPSWCNYETQLSDVAWWLNVLWAERPTNEVMMPLKSIRDSNGRRIDFVLTSIPYGGKYRIAEIHSVSPDGTDAVYTLTYEERNIRSYLESVPVEFWAGKPPRPTCAQGGTCLAPQMDGSPVNQVIENVAFLVKVERPDHQTVEYDYYPWGDLKAIRTLYGGIVTYTWGYWDRPPREYPWRNYPESVQITQKGIKIGGREVRTRLGDLPAEAYTWSFEKNFLPARLDSVMLLDQDRTIVTTPEGNDVAYRFSDFGPVRNIKTYAGRAFRWLQQDIDATPANLISSAEGRLLREVNRWHEQGSVYDAVTFPIVTNVEGTEYVGSGSPMVNTRPVREETYYLDDPIGAAPTGDITQDWRYDIKGTTFAFDGSGTRKNPKAAYSYASWSLQGWQELRGYRITVQEGSALGVKRTVERKFTDFWQLSAEEAAAENQGFRWPIAWVRERQTSGPVTNQTISESLTEYQYDLGQIHRIINEIRRKNPSAVVPNDHPYSFHSPGSNGDVNIVYVLWPKRDLTLALPTAPEPTAYGLPSRVTQSGGDPLTTQANATGDSEIVYDETRDYQYGQISIKQVLPITQLSWRALDATISPSGHVTQIRDTSGVPKTLTYDAAGDLTTVDPGGGEYASHVDKDLRDIAPQNDEFIFRAGRKLFGQVAWKGPEGAAYRTSSSCTYLETDVDGLGRMSRQERKLQDGSTIVEKKLTYGVALPDGVHKGGWDRTTKETEWSAIGTVTPPATNKFLTIEGTGDAVLDGRIDPFLREWKSIAADSATLKTRHFGLNRVQTIEGIHGLNGSLINSRTTYYVDGLGRVRIVDGPIGAADAYHEYDVFGNVTRAMLVDQIQYAPQSDSNGIYTDRFGIGNTSGQTRSFVLDGLGRVRQATNPENGTVNLYAYDPAGKLLISKDAKGTVLWRSYDPAGRMIRLERCNGSDPSQPCTPTTEKVSLAEFSFHNVTQDPAALGRGSSLGKLLTIKGRDDAGLLQAQEDYYYSELNGRISEERVAFRDWQPGSTIEGGTSPSYAVGYHYGPEGAIRDVSYPRPVGSLIDATSVTYGYTHGWLGSVNSNRPGISALLSYHPSGLVKQISHGNGTRTAIGADVRGRVASIDVTDAAAASLWSTGTHRYDQGGNLYEIGEDSPHFPADDHWQFAYDYSQRLVGAKLAGYDVMYDYDVYGNLVGQRFPSGPKVVGMAFQGRSYTDSQGNNKNQVQLPGLMYDANNNLVPAPPYSYDSNGDTRDSEGLGYDYDVLSRMTAAGTVDVNSQLIPNGVYRYAGTGFRSSKEDRISGWTTFYIRSLSGEVLSEYARPNAGGSPGWSRDYIYGVDRHLAVVENGPPSVPGGYSSCSQADTRTCGQPTGGYPVITIDWVNNADADIYGYRLYRADSSSSFTAGATSPPVRLHAGELTFSYFADTGEKSCPAGGAQYCWYALTAVDRSGKESGYSTPIAIQTGDTTPPGAARQLSVTGYTSTTVSMSWAAPSGTAPPDFLGYYVWRGVSSNDPNPVLINTVPLTGTALTDVGLNCGVVYYYRVTSTDTSSNQAAFSGEVSATTGPCGSGGGDGSGGKKHTSLRPSDGLPSEDGALPVIGVAEASEIAPEEIAPAAENGEVKRALQIEALASRDKDGSAGAPHQSVGQAALDWVGYTLHTDHLGSIRLVTSAAGQIVAKHRYFPFGQEIGPIQKSPSSHRYIGREWDPESGSLYLMARYAQIRTGGRFLTVDPNPGSPLRLASLNRYAYGFDSPLRFYDPTGLINFLAGGQLSMVGPTGGWQVTVGVALNPGWGGSEWGLATYLTVAPVALGMNQSAEVFAGALSGNLENVEGPFVNFDQGFEPVALSQSVGCDGGCYGQTIGYSVGAIPITWSSSTSETSYTVWFGGSGSKSSSGSRGGGGGTNFGAALQAVYTSVSTTWWCSDPKCGGDSTGKK